MQWLLTRKVWLLNTRKVHLAHFLKKVDIVRFNSKPSILSWGADSNTIFILQKKAVRAIASAGYNAHTEPFFKLYNLLKIEDIYKFRLLVLYHNISHLKTP